MQSNSRKNLEPAEDKAVGRQEGNRNDGADGWKYLLGSQRLMKGYNQVAEEKGCILFAIVFQ